MKVNFHTHHVLCRHASGRCEDYVKQALYHNFDELGFSDHIPDKELQPDNRMFESELQEYFDDITLVQNKYKNKLTIYRGIESEFFYPDINKYEILHKKLDYMVLGLHYISMTQNKKNLLSCFNLTTKEEIHMYATYACDAMRSGYFTIMAHPDLYMNNYPSFDEDAIAVAHKICKCAEETNVILEYNANGYRRRKRNTENGKSRPYPRFEFWTIAEQYKIHTILSSDCHNPKFLYDDITREAEEDFRFISVKKITSYSEFPKNTGEK